MAMLIIGLIIAWMLVSALIIIGVAMATSQGSRRENGLKSLDSTPTPSRKVPIQIDQNRPHSTLPGPL